MWKDSLLTARTGNMILVCRSNLSCSSLLHINYIRRTDAFLNMGLLIAVFFVFIVGLYI